MANIVGWGVKLCTRTLLRSGKRQNLCCQVIAITWQYAGIKTSVGNAVKTDT